MDNTNMVLKTNLSQVLEILKYIILIYAIFLTVFGIISHNSELVIQTVIMFTVCAIFKYINSDYITISSEGLNSQKYGNIEWNDIRKVTRKEKTLLVFSKKRKRPYKFIIKKDEDDIEISRVYKYILSKCIEV